MNKQEADVLKALIVEPYINQRVLSNLCGHSLGIVNKSIKNLIKTGMLDEEIKPTKLALKELQIKSPQNAIILAAGFGMRMVPINTQVPKALIKVNGEALIERVIRQLQEVGINKIIVVVGFMKEQFEYLIDEYGIQLIVNENYAKSNNLHSLALAADYISNTYIVPCDIWCDKNPFSKQELYPWYMVSDLVDNNSSVRVNRKMELVLVDENQGGNAMVGIAYLTGEQSILIRERLTRYDKTAKYNHSFWEEVLFNSDRMIVQAKTVCATDVVEINTYEQLRELDEESDHLKSDAINVITDCLGVNRNEIVDIEVLKKGMTNRSFVFCCRNKRYIMRIPGEGTDRLINREEEAEVYKVIKNKKICDDVIYLNPDNGYKITRFVEKSRVCNPECNEDLVACMKKLKEFHAQNLHVNHEFDIYKQIDFYESLWAGVPSIYRDYLKTKEHVLELRNYIDCHVEKKCLAHIDAVPDNFLFTEEGDILLIDWEYAGMQDPLVDIAMFCIYSLYNRNQIDNLIDIYFEGKCNKGDRLKIYCYISACGLLWSNWCEYKRSLGVEFGEYSLRQYRYAKEYYRIFKEEQDV